MSRNGYKVMDSDMHVVEPSDLFERYLDARSPRLAAPHRSSSYGNCTRRGGEGFPLLDGVVCEALLWTTAARAGDWRCSPDAAGAARGVVAKRRAGDGRGWSNRNAANPALAVA